VINHTYKTAQVIFVKTEDTAFTKLGYLTPF